MVFSVLIINCLGKFLCVSLLAVLVENLPVTGGRISHKGPVMYSFDVFVILKLLNK